MKYQELLDTWLNNAVEDTDLIEELNSVKSEEDQVIDRFYRELEFGTGGLRGVIGAGTNRMNIYTICKATQGIAQYLNDTVKNASVAIAYDSRIKSDLFARKAAEVFAGNGIKVYIYKELMPTPMLSFAVRRLNCDAGVVVTASHNPSKYNGYKVYGNDGCQLTLEASEYVLGIIETVDIFTGVKKADFDTAVADGLIRFIEEDTVEAYLTEVEKRSINTEILKSSDMKVIYTPLNGTGNKPVRAILDKIGIKNVTIVKEQELPDGNFPTCPFPNPEIRQVFECAIELAKDIQPDLLLATDPDCDRVGIAVLHQGEFILMSGNEVGAMLLDYVLRERTANGTLPKNPIAVKTIVTTDIAALIAKKYNCEIIDVLTGFKFIGEQIGLLEAKGEEDRFVFGYEESYGYLAGSYVRDKDAVVASMLICEMAAFYKKQNKTLIDVMNGLYSEFGMFRHTQLNVTCEGMSGMARMAEIMTELKSISPAQIGGLKVLSIVDYDASTQKDIVTGEVKPIDLPKSNVISFKLENDGGSIVRPSGTEPKIKIYITAKAQTAEIATEISEKIAADTKKLMGV
ncbi:MAG: phosphoglucomutase [Clostridiales bacterium 43-6]|nr:MAG: phosphoglucomutase [Clostridiales bacterium 43-6]